MKKTSNKILMATLIVAVLCSIAVMIALRVMIG